MAPLPKRKHSQSRGRMRSEVKKLTQIRLIPCSSCGKAIRSHRVCPFCGFYNGKIVFSVKTHEKEKEK